MHQNSKRKIWSLNKQIRKKIFTNNTVFTLLKTCTQQKHTSEKYCTCRYCLHGKWPALTTTTPCGMHRCMHTSNAANTASYSDTLVMRQKVGVHTGRFSKYSIVSCYAVTCQKVRLHTGRFIKYSIVSCYAVTCQKVSVHIGRFIRR